MTGRPKGEKMGLGRAAVLLLGFGLITLGVWQLGGGVYIYAKAEIGQLLLADSWDRARKGEAAPRPWNWADIWPVARLEVPRFGIDAYVLNDVSGEAMAWGPGHMPGTPVPGTPGLSVLGGHRDTHFSFLKDLVPGDIVMVETDSGITHTFRVETRELADAYNHSLSFRGGPPRLALITCWPFDALTTGGSERYVVTAALVE